MPYVRSDENGKVTGMSVEPLEGWERVAGDDARLTSFGTHLVGAHRGMRESDLTVVRVLDDLINLLIEKNTIRFTDLPEAAQMKLLERRGMRERGTHFGLLKDDPPLV